MSKVKKTWSRLHQSPTLANIKWDDLVSLMSKLGFVKSEGGGSHMAFVHSESLLSFSTSRPHPGNEVKRYVVNNLVAFFAENKITFQEAQTDE